MIIISVLNCIQFYMTVGERYENCLGGDYFQNLFLFLEIASPSWGRSEWNLCNIDISQINPILIRFYETAMLIQ